MAPFDATFDAPFQAATQTLPQDLVLADFNRDGLPDLATGNLSSNSVSVLGGRGMDQLSTLATVSTGSMPVTSGIGMAAK